MKKSKLCFLSMVVCIALTVFVAGCGGDSSADGTGTLKVTLQDAPGDIEILEVTIDEVAVHFVPNGAVEEDGDVDIDIDEEETEDGSDDSGNAGWKVLLTGPKMFDLITLKDNPTELGILELAPGKVTQIRLILSETTPAKLVVDSEEHDLTVPSGTVKLTGNFKIVADQETQIKLDFDAEKSVSQTGNGEYKLQPTIKVLD